MLEPELVQQTAEMVRVIRARLEAAQDSQKKYTDDHKKKRDFEEGDHVFLKVSL